MAKLTIAYSTLASRIGNIQFPTTEHEILVLVQNQNGQEYSTQTSNGNKTVVAIPGIGVAKSRNHAVALANTEYLLFADDDVEFHCSQIGDAIALMDADPDCVLLATFRRMMEEARLGRITPKTIDDCQNLTQPVQQPMKS